MPLALHPNPVGASARRNTDHLVMNGQLAVGRIYKRDTPDKLDSQWLWAINGVWAEPAIMRFAGIAPSFEQAMAELQENWEKWLAWANLQDIGGAVPLQPASTRAPSEEIVGVPLQPEPTPATSDPAQHSSETSSDPARVRQSADAGRRGSASRKKSK
jgi:hypothetical protein